MTYLNNVHPQIKQSITIFLFILIFSRAAYGQQDLCQVPCSSVIQCISNANIILIDRTTKLTSQGIADLKFGIYSISYAKNICGLLIPYEVRDFAYASSKVTKQYQCVKPYPVSKKEVKSQKKFFDNLAYAATKYFKNFGESDGSLKVEMKKIQDEREQIAEEILATPEVPETTQTSLVETFIRYYNEYRHKYKTINFFIFTDLEDTILSQALKNNNTDWNKLAESLFQKYQNSYRDVKPDTNIHIIFWGIGRSEVPGKHYLDPSQVKKLINFWNIFLSKFAPASNITFNKEFPTELYPVDE